MKLCRILLKDEKYHEFWEKFNDVETILRTFGFILDELKRFQSHKEQYDEDDVFSFIKEHLSYYTLFRFYRACLNDKRMFTHRHIRLIPSFSPLELLLYNTPSIDNRLHLFSDILPDYHRFKNWLNELTPAIKIEQINEIDKESRQKNHRARKDAFYKHFEQYGVNSTIINYSVIIHEQNKSIEINMPDHILQYFHLSDINRFKIERMANHAIQYAQLFIKWIDYLADIYRVNLSTIKQPPIYPYKKTDLSAPVNYTPFTNNSDLFINFIDQALRMQRSKKSKLLATIILAMERKNIMHTSQNLTERLEFLSQHIPNFPTRQGISKHLSTYKTSQNRSSRSYGGITEEEIDTISQKIEDFIGKMNS